MNWASLRWSLYAPVYDLAVAWFTRSARKRSIVSLELQPLDNVAILGCGTGLDFPYLPKGQETIAIDLSAAMVDRALREAIKYSGIKVKQGDVTATELAEASVDAVILHLIVAVVPDPEAVFLEVFRILKPGGRVAIFDKGLMEGERPTRLRTLLNALIKPVATAIDVPLEHLALANGFDVLIKTKVVSGLFWLVLLKKPFKNSN